MPKTTLFLLAAATLVCSLPAPAGTSQPNVIRQVHIGGVPGPAYYSVVDGGYRPIGLRSAPASRTDPARVADIADLSGPN